VKNAMTVNDPYIGLEIADGKYKTLHRIGTGGMGSVYKATQPQMGRLVAIKIMHSKFVRRRDLVGRFRREAKALGALSHPNTVKVFDNGILPDGAPFLVMEFLEGKNLHQTMTTEGPLSVRRVLSVMIQVCHAIDEAHHQGIVHRDLKPENIFLCQQGGIKDFAKVLDFGLAKMTDVNVKPESLVLTAKGMVFGTLQFLSPEQAQGKKLDARSDVYSLAVILYEALTGKLPFDAKEAFEYVRLHISEPPIPLDQRVPGLVFPSALPAVVAKALAKEPRHRYATALEFALALKRCNAEVTSASRRDATPVAPRAALMPGPAPAASEKKARFFDRRVPLVITILVGFHCFLLGVLFALLVLRMVGRR